MDENEELQDAATRNVVHLTSEDYRILVNWMEVKENFEAIHGTGTKLPVGGKRKVKKKDAFTNLAYHLHKKTTNEALREVELSGRNMQQRWRTYMQRFKRTLKASHNETGLGLSRRELAQGMSIPQKLERMCPHFNRMKVLFGEKANIKPFATVELGVPSTPSNSDESDNNYDLGNGNGFNDNDSSNDDNNGLDDWHDPDLTFVAPAQSQMLSLAVDTPSEQLLIPSSVGVPVENEPVATTRSSSILSENISEDFSEDTSIDGAASATPSQSTVCTRNGHANSTAKAKDRSGSSTNSTKRSDRQQETKRRKTTSTNNKKGSTAAHDTRVSLAIAYAKNSEAKVDYWKQKLAEDRRQWEATHEAAKELRAAEAVIQSKMRIMLCSWFNCVRSSFKDPNLFLRTPIVCSFTTRA